MLKVECVCGWWLFSAREDSSTYEEHKCKKCGNNVSVEIRERKIEVKYLSKKSA